MSIPPSMAWVPDFVRVLNAFMDGRLYGWDVLEDADPLRRILHLRAHSRLQVFEAKHIRNELRTWAEVNDCVYRRSAWKGLDFKAEVILKSLRPESRVNPHTETDDEAIHRNRRKWHRLPGGTNLRSSSNDRAGEPTGVASTVSAGFEEDDGEATGSIDAIFDAVD